MIRLLVFLLCCSITLPALSAGDEGKKSAFDREMFSPSVMGSFGIDPKRLDSLNPKQRHDLLSARQVLIKFLKVSQSHSPDVRRLVDPGFLGRFPDQASLLEKLFGQETEVLVGAVTDFSIGSANEIELGYYIVLFVEGRVVLRDDKTLLRRSGGDWLIVRIGGLQ